MGLIKKAPHKVTGSSERMSEVGLQQAEDDGFTNLSPADEHVEKYSSPHLESTHTIKRSPADEHPEKISSSSMHAAAFSPAIEHSDKSSSIDTHVDADGIGEVLSAATKRLPGLGSPPVSDVPSDGYFGIANNAGCVTQPKALNDDCSSASSDWITVFVDMGSGRRRAIKASLNWTADEFHSIVSTSCGFGANIEDTFLVHGSNPMNGKVTLGQAGITNNAIVNLAARTYGG